MRNKRFQIYLILSFISLCAFSQGEFIIKIDRTDGTFVKVGPAIADVTYIYADDRAFDEDSRIFYFTSSLKSHSLYGIKVSDGALLSRPNINYLVYFQFDNVSKKCTRYHRTMIKTKKLL
jgi:hypothetical protein